MIVMHMSGAYLPQNFYIKEERGLMDSLSGGDREPDVVELDCRDIAGTNCYLDDVAKEELRQRMEPYEPGEIHFLDSGNYHYLSLLWLEKVNEPFSLVLFDHHPDMQPPSFGQITSCGGWVLEALESLPNLQRVYMVGVDEYLLEQMDDHPKVQSGLEGIEKDKRPVYLSFDKDVLRREDAICDWDQGEMSLEEALELLGQAAKIHRILGMDVCGEDSKWQESCRGEETVTVNDRTNDKLLEFWNEIKKDDLS